MLFDPPLPVPTPEQIPSLTYDHLARHAQLAKDNISGYAHLRDALKAEIESRTPERNYACKSCGHKHFDSMELRASGGALSSIAGLETNVFRALVCQRCKFTELYQGSASGMQLALDFLIS